MRVARKESGDYLFMRSLDDGVRDISLVAAIHGQHWTGHVFNDLCEGASQCPVACRADRPSPDPRVPAGVGGRYYWQNGDYRPDERMGGEAGFGALVDGIREIGARSMPMFGMNRS